MPHRFIELRFEDFVDVYTGAWKLPFGHAEVRSPKAWRAAAVLNMHYNAQEDREFPVYEKWTKKQRNTLYRIAGDVMERLNYE